jgi:hypothetical protein
MARRSFARDRTEPYAGGLAFKLTHDQAERLAALASRRKVPEAVLVREAIAAWLAAGAPEPVEVEVRGAAEPAPFRRKVDLTADQIAAVRSVAQGRAGRVEGVGAVSAVIRQAVAAYLTRS